MKKFNDRAVAFAGLALAALAMAGCATPTARQSGAPAAQAATAPVAADAQRLIPLQGALNVRSFANLRGRNGPIPAASFVRAADLSRLTAADRDALLAAGVRLDLDLRTAEEEGSSPDLLARDERFGYQRISLLGAEKIDMSNMPGSLGELYVKSLAANQPQFRQVFAAMAAQQEGAVLFHCTAGKDRTGMIAAILLQLAGVPRNDIVHNYALSAGYLKPMMQSNEQMAEMVKSNPKLAGLMGSPPEAMQAFLDALDRQYGGARAYLAAIGLSDGEVQRLLARLGQSG
ncbi:MAG: tyrosine-protein phosphatase [Steroidobacteraceae bacterium]